MFENLKINLKSNWLEIWLHKKNNSDFKSSDTFIKEVLRSFKSIKKSIKNNICYNKIMMFNEHSKDNDNIKSMYKSFQSTRFWSKKKM